MIAFLKKNKFILAGVLAGMAGGFLYWNQIGCSSGTCGITSIWYSSTLYGAVMGGLLVSMFQPGKESKEGQE